MLNSKAGEYESIYALYRKTLWLRMPKLVEISHGTKDTVCSFETTNSQLFITSSVIKPKIILSISLEVKRLYELRTISMRNDLE